MVYHVLADGSRTTDITGYVVKKEYAGSVYELMARISKKGQKRRKSEKKNS
jgi:hypothetical protein